MSPVCTRLACALVATALCACFVELDDRPGRACDDVTPCRAPRQCVAGRCFSPAEVDGGAAMSAGGSATGGGAALAGGSASSAGGAGGGVAPLWQQRVHGFSDVTVEPGCAATIDASRGNLVVSTVVSTRDSEDTASANVLATQRLPTKLEGRVRGRISLGAAPALTGNATFLELGAQPSRVHLQLALSSAGELVVSSQAMTVADNAVSARYAVDGGWGPGEYLVEVRWRRGDARMVWLNGELLGQAALPSTTVPAPPDRLRLGILRLDGVDGGGLSLSASGWQLTDDPDLTLGDVP